MTVPACFCHSLGCLFICEELVVIFQDWNHDGLLRRFLIACGDCHCTFAFCLSVVVRISGFRADAAASTVPPIAARLAHHLVLQQQQLLSLVPHPVIALLFVYHGGVTLAADSTKQAYLMPAAICHGPAECYSASNSNCNGTAHPTCKYELFRAD